MTTAEMKRYIKVIKETGEEIVNDKKKREKLLQDIGLTTKNGKINKRFIKK